EAASGRGRFERPGDAVQALAAALEAYQRTAPEFHPYTSKYDAYLRGRTALSARERRGLALFDDPRKGNCAGCHPDSLSPRGEPPAFTDFGFAAIGAPRNRALAANRDPAHFDLGLCGPRRRDLARHAEFCGEFMTPTLRNVATRRSFFHNGVFHSLRQVMRFYVDRDLHPRRWYGGMGACDDLPPAYRGNVDDEVPFRPPPGRRPRLDAREIDDVIAFLDTLTDGYTAPATPATPDPEVASSTPASRRHQEAGERVHD
ncbi:MAG TPA: cytochrome-c peroxidase, partial [Burkholderiaceae bacterium]